jgi:hypothetical protein
VVGIIDRAHKLPFISATRCERSLPNATAAQKQVGGFAVAVSIRVRERNPMLSKPYY